MITVINILFYLLAFIFPFGQFSRILVGRGLPEEVKVYLPDILVFSIFLSWLVWHIFSRKKIFWPPFTKSLFWLWSCLFLSFLLNLLNFSIIELLVGFAYFLRFFFYSFLGLILFDLNKNQFRINRDSVARFFPWLGLSLSVIGLIQYLLIPDIRPLASLGWDLHYYRAVGSFLDPNFLGIVLVLPILFLVSKILKTKKLAKREIFLLLLILLVFFLTYSRGAYLSLLAGLGVLLWRIKKTKFIFWIMGGFLLVILLLPRPGGEGVRLERTASIIQRSENWQTAIKIWRQSPLFGVGFNNYRYQLHNLGLLSEEDWRQSHAASGVENSFLLVLATSGVVGFFCLVNFLVQTIGGINTKKSIWREFSISGLVSISLSALFINSLFYPWVMIGFWATLALGFMD